MNKALTGLVNFSIKMVISLKPERLEAKHHILNVDVWKRESKPVSGVTEYPQQEHSVTHPIYHHNVSS